MGYNLYRDGYLLNTEPITDNSYKDVVTEYKEYTYRVKSVYSETGESSDFAEVKVEVKDKGALPFYDNFRSWRFETNEWTLAEGESSAWSVNYYEFGWMEPCATYRILADGDYSQSLLTRKLYTTDKDNVMLRFNLRNRRIDERYRNYLHIEVSKDKKTWKKVDELLSLDFSPLITEYMHYDLGEFLDDESFYIRFRTQGGYTYYIEYWYIDEVKVWNPIWTNAKLSVNALGASLPGCDVRLINSEGIPYDFVTDMTGNLLIDKIEADTYTVIVDKNGMNRFEEKWTLTNDGSNEYTANLTSPVLSLDKTTVYTEINAESEAKETVTLSNSGTGSVRWSLNQQHKEKSGVITNRWAFQGSFRTSGDLQSAVGFDGEFYYTGSWLFQGVFNKYDREGNLIEEFQIPGIYTGITDFAYDGQFFYAPNSKNHIFKIDMRNKVLVDEIVIKAYPTLEINHCAYDSRNDGSLWIGSYDNVCRVNMEGEVLGVALRTIDSGTSSRIFIEGSAFDNITPGGPYLWLATSMNNNTSGNTYDGVTLCQFSLNRMQLTNVNYFVGDIPGYINGSETAGSVYATSLSTTFDVEDGTYSLIGSLSNSPSTIYKLKLCDLPSWLSYSPKQGTLPANGSQEIELTVNSIAGMLDETYNTTLSFNNFPFSAVSDIDVSYKVTGKALYARPVNVAVSNAGKESINVSWQEGDGANTPTGYNVYRDGVIVNKQPILETSFVDTDLLRGNYDYTVTALYGDVVSQPSEMASGFVKFGIPCYPPIDLTAQVAMNKNVSLAWISPEEVGNVEKVLRWDNGECTNSMGFFEGGTFFIGSLWEHEDLINYRGMKIAEVEMIVNDFVEALVLCIFRDGEQIYIQGVPASDIVYGSPVKVILQEPITIELGYSYTIAFRVTHAERKSPVGMDNSPTVEGKGNLMSNDGKTWNSLTRMGGNAGNFNISYLVVPSDETENTIQTMSAKTGTYKLLLDDRVEMPIVQTPVSTPIVSLMSSSDFVFQGYNVYRNKEKINATMVAEPYYTDVCTAAGDYTYNVTAVYSKGESLFGNDASVAIKSLGNYYAPYGVRPSVELNRKITLDWGYPTSEKPVLGEYLPTNVASPVSYPSYINSWNASISGETGVASDGKYLYTSVWNINGLFNKYTLEGRFVENFTIDGVDALRNLTCDGTYFYGGANGSTVFKLDFEKRELIATFSVSEIVRHCTYIPDLNEGKGGFEVGDWDTSIYTTMSGAKIGNGPTLKGAFGTAYHNGYIYAFEQGTENHHTIGIYDYETYARVGEINPDYYEGLNITSGMLAGGLSSFQTADGVTVMAATFQDAQINKLVLFELEGVLGVEGYNIYCNDEKINDNLVTERKFVDYQYSPGQYAYQVETVYIDGMVSPKSDARIVEIIENGTCKSSDPVKVIQSVSGHNLLLSFVNPDAEEVDLYENASLLTPGELFAKDGWVNASESGGGTWKVTSEYSYHGDNSLVSAPFVGKSDWLITPKLEYNTDFVFSFVARVGNQTAGYGSLKIYTSTGSSSLVDFTLKETLQIEELWNKFTISFDKNVKHIAIVNSNNGDIPYFVDAVSIDETGESSIFGYDIYRNGEKVNKDVVTTISYLDFNLIPGDYEYSVQALYKDGCISELSEPTLFELSYNLPLAAPESFTATVKEEGVRLDWSLPAISEAVNIGWSTGRNYSSAGLPSGGAYYAGMRFTPADMQTVRNMCISYVEVFIDTPPDALFLLIYEENKLVYQQFVTEFRQEYFNKIKLDTPLQINVDKDLKVVLYVEHNSISTPIGFDEGPAVDGKGNLFSKDGVTWSTINEDSDGYLDANWNITVGFNAYQNSYKTQSSKADAVNFEPRNSVASTEALISKKSEMLKDSETRRLYGYHIYRNSERINDEVCTALSYLDNDLGNGGYYEYYVTAVYSQDVEVESDRILLITTGNMEVQGGQGEVTLSDGILSIKGLREGQQIGIYTAAGFALYSTVATSEELSYDISNYVSGVYFVRIADAGRVVHVKKIVK